jgi:ABC-type branched-subunit amino acid transport system substrate-binding protein
MSCRSKRVSRSGHAITAFAVSILFLAGCSGGASDGGSSGSGGDSIKLFLSYSGDNALSPHPETLTAAQAAVMAINESGGVKGKELELVDCANRFEPEQSLVCARKGIADDVVAWVGQDDQQSEQTLPLLASKGIPSIGLYSYSNPADYASPASFPLNAGAAGPTLATPYMLQQLGLNSALSQACEYPGCALLAEMMSTYGPAYNVDVVGDFIEVPNAGLPDYAPAAQRTKGLDPEAVVQIISGGPAIGLVKAGHDVGFNAVYSSNPQVIAEDEASENGPLLEGYLTPASFPSPRSYAEWPVMQQYVDDRGALDGVSGEEWINGTTLSRSWTNDVDAWLSVYAAAQAIELIPGDEVNAAALMEVLNDPSTRIDLFGFQEWTPGAPGPEGYKRMPQMTAYFNKITDGKVTGMDIKPFDIVPMVKQHG